MAAQFCNLKICGIIVLTNTFKNAVANITWHLSLNKYIFEREPSIGFLKNKQA